MAAKTDIALIGAGKIGETIASLLLASTDYRVTLLDRAQEILDVIPEHPELTKIR